MNDENLTQVETNTPEQESDEEKLRAIIKKYSFHSKTSPKTEWWDSD
jgi:hypothetical protein